MEQVCKISQQTQKYENILSVYTLLEEMNDTLNLPKDGTDFNRNVCSQVILQWFSPYVCDISEAATATGGRLHFYAPPHLLGFMPEILNYPKILESTRWALTNATIYLCTMPCLPSCSLFILQKSALTSTLCKSLFIVTFS